MADENKRKEKGALMVINCKDKAEEIKREVKHAVRLLGETQRRAPKLTIVRVGNNPASESYVKGKLKDCEECGINAIEIHCTENISTAELCNVVDNAQLNCDAIIVQLPLPPQIDKEKVLERINPFKDVDGLTKYTQFTPCTPMAVMCVLQDVCGLSLTNKNVLVIGRSKLVGLPLANMLIVENANVSVVHSMTSDEKKAHKSAWSDVIISAAGVRNVVSSSVICCGTYVIDVGINRDENGKLCGDISDSERYYKTPVPNGVGLLTRAMLLRNVLRAYEYATKGKGQI